MRTWRPIVSVAVLLGHDAGSHLWVAGFPCGVGLPWAPGLNVATVSQALENDWRHLRDVVPATLLSKTMQGSTLLWHTGLHGWFVKRV